MGQQNSQLVDPNTPPRTLSERSLEAVAKLINDGRVNRIVVLTGAGISTAAGSKLTRMSLLAVTPICLSSVCLFD